MSGSRKLSIADYLKVLQQEYLSHKVRELIYEDPRFIKMSKEIAEKKKEKIEKLAKKFQLFSIFDSKICFEDFVKNSFFQEFGIPLMQYGAVSEKNQAVFYWDKFFLFKEGYSVEYKGGLHEVVSNHPNRESVELIYKGSKIEIPYVCLKIKRFSIPF